MKRIIAILIICLICVFILAGCDAVQVEHSKTDTKSMFVTVEKTYDWQIVYHKDTKVMYAVSYSAYNHGTFTVLLDENGEPLLWQGEV